MDVKEAEAGKADSRRFQFFYFPFTSCILFCLLAAQAHHSHVLPHRAVAGLGQGRVWVLVLTDGACIIPLGHLSSLSYIPHGEQGQCPSLSASGVVCLSSSPSQGRTASPQVASNLLPGPSTLSGDI